MAEVGGHSYEATRGVDYTSWVNLEIPGEGFRRDEIIHRLSRRVMERANPYVPAIGGIIGEGDDTLRNNVVLGLDPSQSWGTPKPAQNEALGKYIAYKERWMVRDEPLPALRVPLGRRREYDVDNEVIGMEKVEALFRAQGREALKLTAADLFSVRFIPGCKMPVMYQEPGVFVESDQAMLESGVVEDIFATAEVMDQDRLVPAITDVRTQVHARVRKATQ